MLKKYFERFLQNDKAARENLACWPEEELFDTLISSYSYDFIRDDRKHQNALHDANVLRFSQKRSGNEYQVSLAFNAFIYLDGRTVGRQLITFDFNTKTKLHEINNKEIYHFALWNLTKEMGFVYHKNNKLQVIHFNYTNLTRNFGPQVFYK